MPIIDEYRMFGDIFKELRLEKKLSVVIKIGSFPLIFQHFVTVVLPTETNLWAFITLLIITFFLMLSISF